MPKEISVSDLNLNPSEMFGKEWTLITAGTEGSLNTMTASWGTIGYLWNKNVVTTYIRPQRYTFKFTEENEYFSLCFFSPKYKKTLSFCGSKSGKDIDKIKETGLIPIFDESAPYFKQAKLVFICKKIYAQKMDFSCFSDTKILDDWYETEGLKKSYDDVLKKASNNAYKSADMHQIYVGEIVKVLSDE